MDYAEHSLNSMPTMADPNGAPRHAEPLDSHSIGSATTMGGRTTPPHGRFRPGDVLLGRYTVLAELGEGGMGVVYKCLDTIGGIEVAIKCLPPELSRNESEMEGIRENYAIVARLHHSAISGLRQLEKDSEFGEYYLVMDLAKGEDLSAILRKRRGAPMPLDEALAILRPLASALDYAHGEHVLHRDVKPANVKVDGIRVQLLDFGLAAEVRSSMSRVSLRGHAGSSGTPAYMAPEQWEARRQSAATDQYSLAVMAYEMLSGYRPFDTDNMELLKSAVLTRAPEEIEGVPAYVNATLQKALAKNPKDRFASCTEFVDCLANGIFNAMPQRTQSPQSQEDGRADLRVGREVTGGPPFVAAETTHGGRDGARPSPASAVSEADVLRRKLALTRSLKAIPAEDRADNEFAKFVEKAEDELAVAEEACKFGRFAAAAESLNVAENALCDLQTAKRAREEAERKATEEAERKARAEAERKEREWIGSRAGERKTIRIGSQEVALRWCPSGTFTMGSPASEEGRHISEMQYRVTLTKGFWMGETQVTQGLWKEVMGSNPSLNKSGDDYPVENVSWNDCQEFLRKLNARTPQSGLTWALPTEAQWEYACRAGSTGAYAGNGRLDDMGWYIANSGNTTHPVARKKPNAWGLYDMHGNVWEWCQNDPFGAVTDPTGAVSGSDRVLRGGGYWGKPQFCRSAYRNWDSPGDRYWSHGFRLLAFQDGK